MTLVCFSQTGSHSISTLNISRLFQQEKKHTLLLKRIKSLSGSPVQGTERFIINFFSSFLLLATRPLRFLKTLHCPMAISQVLERLLRISIIQCHCVLLPPPLHCLITMSSLPEAGKLQGWRSVCAGFLTLSSIFAVMYV